jgi:hypothetical protein
VGRFKNPPLVSANHMLKGSCRQSSRCREGKHDGQSLLKGKKCENMKNPFTLYDQEKSQRKHKENRQIA